MSELPSDSSAQVDREPVKIDSPIKMARALGFDRNSEDFSSQYRLYTKDFPKNNPSAYTAEITLRSFDSREYREGKLEEVYLGVQFKKPCQIWALENSICSESFLGWFTENGGDPQLVEVLKELESSDQRGRISKKLMREKGYGLVVQLIKQAQKLGYFEYLLKNLFSEFEDKMAIAENKAKEFIDAFPEYTLSSDRFYEEKYLYFAKPGTNKGRVQAIRIDIQSNVNDVDGTFDFQLGSMKVDDKGNLSSFFEVDPPVLPSTGKYQQRWFRGNMDNIVAQAIEARKNILRELGK